MDALTTKKRASVSLRLLSPYFLSTSYIESNITLVTLYGLAFEAGLLSSKYPRQFSAVPVGIRIEAPLSAIPHVNLCISCVSNLPVKRKWLSEP